MSVEVVRFVLSGSPTVRAFVDIEIDGWLRFSGVNFLRDGTVKPAQLTYWRDGRRVYRDAIEVLDADLGGILTSDILGAIHRHIEKLPPELRERPVHVPAPQPPPVKVKQPLPPPMRLTIGRNINNPTAPMKRTGAK